MSSFFKIVAAGLLYRVEYEDHSFLFLLNCKPVEVMCELDRCRSKCLLYYW